MRFKSGAGHTENSRMGLLASLASLFARKGPRDQATKDDDAALRHLLRLEQRLNRGEPISPDVAEGIRRVAAKCNGEPFPWEPVESFLQELRRREASGVAFEKIEGKDRYVAFVSGNNMGLTAASEAYQAVLQTHPHPRFELLLYRDSDFRKSSPSEALGARAFRALTPAD